MSCNCCQCLHKTTGLSTAGLLTVTNPNNVGNFDNFCLLLTICPDSVITGVPVAYTVTVNGTAIPILDIWGYPVMTDRLRTRKVYRGRYITTSEGSHITLTNVACGETDVAATIASTSTTSEGD
ncbi:MAG: hypothetical protein J6S85_03940 [Methanobrevibacter sp.]|nr:hypothetical protein [Methanobrevibacter sp.]MBO7712694.1 hypothetical protein [Methanobrevibacter sp.]